MLAVSAVVLGAVLIDIFLGEPSSAFHPVVWMGSFISFIWKKRPRQGRVMPFIFGTVLVVSGTLLFSLPLFLLKELPWLMFIMISIPLLKVSFSLKGLPKAAEEILEALRQKDLVRARKLLSWHLVSRNTNDLDEEAIVAAVVESLAENVTDSFTSPLFYFLLGGVPGAWAYRFCNTCDSMLGYRDSEHEYGGKFAARFDDLLNLIPARITGFLLLAGGALAGEDLSGGWRTMVGQHHRTSSPNAGWTMAAMAGLLGVTLEKKGHYILEGGRSELSVSVIERCLRVLRITDIMIVVLTIFTAGVLHVLFS